MQVEVEAELSDEEKIGESGEKSQPGSGDEKSGDEKSGDEKSGEEKSGEEKSGEENIEGKNKNEDEDERHPAYIPRKVKMKKNEEKKS